MSVEAWTTLLVLLSFIVYLYIRWRSRVQDSQGFFVAARGIPAIANGAATAADWMSAASFISMVGLISFVGYEGSIYSSIFSLSADALKRLLLYLVLIVAYLYSGERDFSIMNGQSHSSACL